MKGMQIAHSKGWIKLIKAVMIGNNTSTVGATMRTCVRFKEYLMLTDLSTSK